METLDTAINDAVSALNAGGDGGETITTETTTTTEPKLTHGLTDEELPNAAQIFSALKDPEKAKVFVKFLAENNGYVLKENGSTQSTEATQEPTMAEMLKEHLGEDFAPFAEKLAPAMEKIVKSAIEKETAPLRQKFQTTEQQAAQNEVATILSDFGKEHFEDGKLPDNVVKEMANLTKTFTPGQGTDQKTYVSSLLKMAMTNLNIASKSSRSAKSANNPFAHLSNNATSKPNSGKETRPTKMSIDEAVMEAARSLGSKN
jgi:hypothetical protein